MKKTIVLDGEALWWTFVEEYGLAVNDDDVLGAITGMFDEIPPYTLDPVEVPLGHCRITVTVERLDEGGDT